MKNVKLDNSHNINKLSTKKAFNVSAIVTAYNFSAMPRFAPRWEKYNFSQMLLVLEGEGKYITDDGEYDI